MEKTAASGSGVPETDIELYTTGTPNGHKISIALEELGLRYSVRRMELRNNEQKEEWFLKINPNGRIPAIVDRTKGPDGQPQNRRVFEGASLLLYLTARYDPHHKISYPYDSDDYWEMVNFLAWQHGGIGPMQGQAFYFVNYAPEKTPYAIDRYITETKRLFSVLETQLEQQAQKQAGADQDGPWVVGDRLTIADLASFGWVNGAELVGIDMDKFPRLKDWVARINARPATQRGLKVPDDFNKAEILAKKETMFEQNKKWILESQQAEREKHN
jgi:glutathione S-transferase